MTDNASRSEGRKSPLVYPHNVEPLRVCDFPMAQRPREMIAQMGQDAVEDYVHLAILLRSGTRGRNVVDLAREMLRKFGSLTALARAHVNELAAFKGVGRVKAQVLKSALELARRMTRESAAGATPIATPQAVADLLREEARVLEQETFWLIMLNARNVMSGAPWRVTQGLLDSSPVHPREVFREAIQRAAAAIVVAHNHPSGDPRPSPDDLRVTRTLVEAGRVVGIKILDHVIVGRAEDGRGRDYCSLRESGLVSFD